MTRYTIERVYLPTETLGSWWDADRELICKTLELPWRHNHMNISCIPENVYIVKKQPPGFGRSYGYFRFMQVPGRGFNRQAGMSTILVHRITYVKDLQGCIGVGGRFIDINKDGVPDMGDSSKKLQWMYENLPDEFELEIKTRP